MISDGPGGGLPRGLIPLLSTGNFVIGVGGFLVIGALAPMARDLGLSAAQAGWIMTTYALAYAVLSPLLVAVTGGMGRRRVLVLGMALFALGALGSAVAPSVEMLFAARMIAAAGAGMTTPVAAAVASALAPPEQRGRVLAHVFLGLTLAGVLGVPLGSWVAYTFGWRVAFGGVAVAAGLMTMVLWRRVPVGLRFQPVRLGDLGRMLMNGRHMLAISFTALFLGAIYVPYTYIAPLLEDRMALGRDGVTVALIICGIGAVAGNLLGGSLSDRMGAFRTLLYLACAQVVLMPLLSLLPVPLTAAIVLLLIWNASGFAFNSSQQSRLVTLTGTQAPVALALNAAAIYVGAAIGGAIGSGVIAQAGLGALGLAGGLCAVCAIVGLVWSQRLSPVDTDPARP
ncbi:MFS transporter [Jannaschia pagri]|uniref:MFS transporter n=1 Tax=Jannaschia pagri TaxID=2829797 RepID=A0ABQ4NI37_9RHOB|nr:MULTISPECIES: MFS transporter [unclassified Jannaschia]GIT89799.1 MFS transporter [Jannaschia sp. AI_61]GIT94093.1 MFS transporter [Jannaschia sp. AI_62]